MIVDGLILLLLLLSAVISIARGFYSELVSLGIWVFAIAVTLFLSSRFSSLLPVDTIESPTARLSISAITLFFGSMLLGSLFNWLFQRLMENRPKRMLNRILGLVFGLVRGAIIVGVLVLFAHLVPSLQQETWWEESHFLSAFENIAKAIHSLLPQELAQHFDFSPTNT
jgi:membrane protein required for colicin V production